MFPQQSIWLLHLTGILYMKLQLSAYETRASSVPGPSINTCLGRDPAGQGCEAMANAVNAEMGRVATLGMQR